MYSMEDCIFDSLSIKEITLKVYYIHGCRFNNTKINIQTRNGTTQSEKVSIDHCDFNNSRLSNLVLATKDRELKISKSKLMDTVVHVGNINTPGLPATTILEDCDLLSKTISNLFSTDFNQPSGLIQLKDCNIEISNPNFLYLIKHEKTIVPLVFTLILKDSNFKYTGGSTPLNLSYYNSIKPMIKLISSNNVFTNITLPAEDPGIFVGYDIDNTFIANVTLQLDGAMYSTRVDHNLNTLEPYVLCISTVSEIVQPIISIIDNNSIIIKHTQNTNLKVVVKKL